MKQQSDIKTALERSVRTLELKPGKALATRSTTARLVDGLTTEARDGEWAVTSDVVEMLGGNHSAPSPSAYGRMALGCCMAMGYGMWLSRLEVPYEDIRVEVEGDLNFLGILGMDDGVYAGHPELRVNVHITSPAERERVEQAVALADRYSLMLNLVQNPTPVSRTLHLNTGEDEAPMEAAPAPATGPQRVSRWSP